MDNQYLSKIQDLLKDNNEEEQPNKINSNVINKEDETPKEEIPIKKVSNNIDDMPIKGGSNFNELLEREMSKEQNEGIYNEMNQNVEPKFKYIPKKRNDIVSIPSNTKKYKYYSDNFKSNKKKNKKNDDNNDDDMKINNFKNQKKDSNYSYNKPKEKKEKYDSYENNNNNIKEQSFPSNQNKKKSKIIDRKFDFDDFKQNQNANSKKKNIPIASNNKINKSNKYKENSNSKPKYNNNINKSKGINENVMDFESFKKKKNLGNKNKINSFWFITIIIIFRF